MGQYFKPTNLDVKEDMRSWAYMTGSKLMEHSYFFNPFVVEVIYLLMGKWCFERVVWSGDYSEDAENEWNEYEYTTILPRNFKYSPQGDITSESFEKELKPRIKILSDSYYFVNQDKEIYCRLDCCRETKTGLRVSPIPLLLSNSCGEGGGDYREDCNDYQHVGTWAYDRVGVVHFSQIPDEFKQVSYDFFE